jgi:hypothetical protein
VKTGAQFPLYDEPEKEWLDWNPDIVLLQAEQARPLPPKNK